jgi:hypothetical protein
MITLTLLALFILFALFALSQIVSPYKFLYICLITLPLNFVFVELAGVPIHLLALTFVILVILVSGEFGTCKDKALFAYWSCFVSSLILSEFYSKGFQFSWFTLYWILTIPVFWLILSPPNETLSLTIDKLLIGAGTVSSLTSLVLFWVPQLNFFLPNPRRFYVNEYGILRFGGTLGDYELFAELLVLAIICLFSPWRRTGKRISVSTLLSFVLMSIALIQTSTISALLVIPGILASISVSNLKFSKRIFTLISMFSVLCLIIIEFGAKIIHRISRLSFDGSIAQSIHRRNVWSKYDSLKPSDGWIGNGTRFPWEEFGAYPHSLFKSLLYLGGYLSICVFSFFMLMLFKRLIEHLRKSPVGISLFPMIVVVVFLINQVKVEFLRIETYLVLVSAMFASARLTTQLDHNTLFSPRKKVHE